MKSYIKIKFIGSVLMLSLLSLGLVTGCSPSGQSMTDTANEGLSDERMPVPQYPLSVGRPLR